MSMKFTRAFCLLVVILLGFTNPASAEPIWEFEVPVILKNISKEVKYVRIKWGIMEYLGKFVLEGTKETNVGGFTDGNMSFTFKVTIQDTDIKDFTKARFFSAKLELSEDGMVYYEPSEKGTPGKPWTQAKPGTKLVTLMVSEELT